MNTKNNEVKDVKAKLSTLWIFVMFNMFYVDFLSLADPESPISSIVNGEPIPREFLLIVAILMESAIVMIILSRFLKYKANRWTNIIVGSIHIVAVIAGGWSGLYYYFFAAIEVTAMSLIIWYAWKWPKPSLKIK